MTTPIILFRLYLDSATEYNSAAFIHYPTRVYNGRVLNWGFIERSVSSPAGLPQVSSARVRVSDTDHYFRDLFADASPMQTPMERLCDLRLLNSGEAEAAAEFLYAGQVAGFEFGDGFCDLELVDITFDWLDEEWPGLLFAGQFFPTIFGQCYQETSIDSHGLVPLPHLGFSLANGDRWALSLGTVEEVAFVHRFTPSTQTWDVPDPSEYTITEDTADLGGVTYTASYLDFTDEQEEGTLIRVDVDGYKTRPAFGSLGSSSSGTKRNPIDTFINIMDIAQQKIGRTLSFNTTSIVALHTLFQSIISQLSPPLPYRCDGAILHSITFRSLLSQFLTSFNLDLFQNRSGQIDLGFINGTNGSRPVFTETLEILQGSFRQRHPSPAFNQINYRLARNYPEDAWTFELTHENTADQTLLGANSSPPGSKVRAETLEFWFVRDVYTAADVASRRAGFLTLSSYRVEFSLPLPEVIDLSDFELCGQVGVTMRSGLSAGGFTNKEVRITGISSDLDTMTAHVQAIIWNEQEWQEPEEAVIEMQTQMDFEVYLSGTFVASNP